MVESALNWICKCVVCSTPCAVLVNLWDITHCKNKTVKSVIICHHVWGLSSFQNQCEDFENLLVFRRQACILLKLLKVPLCCARKCIFLKVCVRGTPDITRWISVSYRVDASETVRFYLREPTFSWRFYEDFYNLLLTSLFAKDNIRPCCSGMGTNLLWTEYFLFLYLHHNYHW